MTINSFILPEDRALLKDIKEDLRSIKFTSQGSITQNLEKTTFSKKFIYRFDKEKKVYKINYIKNGLVWVFEGVTLANTIKKESL